ncbi:MAG: hypothetical protein AAFQ82_28250 [Myxococcota bacterium]
MKFWVLAGCSGAMLLGACAQTLTVLSESPGRGARVSLHGDSWADEHPENDERLREIFERVCPEGYSVVSEGVKERELLEQVPKAASSPDPDRPPGVNRDFWEPRPYYTRQGQVLEIKCTHRTEAPIRSADRQPVLHACEFGDVASACLRLARQAAKERDFESELAFAEKACALGAEEACARSRQIQSGDLEPDAPAPTLLPPSK